MKRAAQFLASLFWRARNFLNECRFRWPVGTVIVLGFLIALVFGWVRIDIQIR